MKKTQQVKGAKIMNITTAINMIRQILNPMKCVVYVEEDTSWRTMIMLKVIDYKMYCLRIWQQINATKHVSDIRP